jgi:hypothetical protein
MIAEKRREDTNIIFSPSMFCPAMDLTPPSFHRIMVSTSVNAECLLLIFCCSEVEQIKVGLRQQIHVHSTSVGC